MTNTNKEKVLNALKENKLVKIISGIKNYDKQKTLSVAMAAEFGGASALDICDDEEIIKTIRATVQLPLFVSSVDAKKLIKAQSLGADVLEIGNYESFYLEGKMFTPQEILTITKEVKQSLKKDVLLCCTIPATLEVENQLNLTKQLLELGVDIIQTEGFAQTIATSDRKDITFTDILKAASTLTNTVEIRKTFPKAMIITASGITQTTAGVAIGMGASGIGVGNFINSLQSQVEMTERVKELVESINQVSETKAAQPKKQLLKV